MVFTLIHNAKTTLKILSDAKMNTNYRDKLPSQVLQNLHTTFTQNILHPITIFCKKNTEYAHFPSIITFYQNIHDCVLSIFSDFYYILITTIILIIILFLFQNIIIIILIILCLHHSRVLIYLILLYCSHVDCLYRSYERVIISVISEFIAVL